MSFPFLHLVHSLILTPFTLLFIFETAVSKSKALGRVISALSKIALLKLYGVSWWWNNFKAMENSSEAGPEVLDQKMAEPSNGTLNGSKVCL